MSTKTCVLLEMPRSTSKSPVAVAGKCFMPMKQVALMTALCVGTLTLLSSTQTELHAKTSTATPHTEAISETGRVFQPSWIISSASLSTPSLPQNNPLPPSAIPSVDFDKEQLTPLQLAALQRHIQDEFRVSPRLVKHLVDVAYDVGEEKNLDPLLLLAIMAVESRFNPKAQSGAGAQGVMQIMTQIHRKRFQAYGGIDSVWEPHANVNVGAEILKSYIEKGGSLHAGLKLYVGSGGPQGVRYSQRVVNEFKKLVSVVYIKSPVVTQESLS